MKIYERVHADGIAYSLEPISPARRSRNILTEVPRPLVNPGNALSVFELLILEDVLLLIQRFSNRKADLRHFLPTHVTLAFLKYEHALELQ